MNYTATWRDGVVFSCRGSSIEEAAQHAITRRYGRGDAQRTTGTRGLSGYFQGYRGIPGGLSSYGEPVHLGER